MSLERDLIRRPQAFKRSLCIALLVFGVLTVVWGFQNARTRSWYAATGHVTKQIASPPFMGRRILFVQYEYEIDSIDYKGTRIQYGLIGVYPEEFVRETATGRTVRLYPKPGRSGTAVLIKGSTYGWIDNVFICFLLLTIAFFVFKRM